MQVDLCIFLDGNKLEEYVPLFIETLFKNCNTSQLHIHVVEKGIHPNHTCESGEHPDPSKYVPVGSHIHNYLLRKQTESWDRLVPFTIYQMHDPSVFFKKSEPGESYCDQAQDHGNSLNWAMDHCGSNKWIIFCHSDMVFIGDAVTALINELKEDMGLCGLYSHFFAVNREAYNRVGTKFNSIPGFKAVPTPQHRGFDYEIRHSFDSRCTADSKIIYGWDVGELLELMMIANGWKCIMSQFILSEIFSMISHLGSGHEYTTNEEMKRGHAEKRRNWMKQYTINKIEGN